MMLDSIINISKMSSKNTLQEYCQKHKLSLPNYVTPRISKITDQPLFESTITFNGITYKATGATKIMAEKDVAQLVCNNMASLKLTETIPQLYQKYESLEKSPINKYKNIYLVDGDNCNIVNEKLFDDPNNFVIYFIAKNNTKPFPMTHQKTYENCCVFISDTINRDAVDHLITLYLGKMTILIPDKIFYVVTKDHFGECLEKFVKDCHLICNI